MNGPSNPGYIDTHVYVYDCVYVHVCVWESMSLNEHCVYLILYIYSSGIHKDNRTTVEVITLFRSFSDYKLIIEALIEWTGKSKSASKS